MGDLAFLRVKKCPVDMFSAGKICDMAKMGI